MAGFTRYSGLNNKQVLIPLALILLLGSVLRFYGLEVQSLWTDELETCISTDYDTLPEVIRELHSDEVHPPGYYILIFYVRKFFGDSEFTLRFPSAVFGILSIYVIYLLGLQLYSPREGLIASALTAILWFPIYYSQETRFYSMLLFSTSLSMYYWLSIVRRLDEHEQPTASSVIGYVLTATISAYVHYFGLLFVVLQGVYSGLVFLWRRHSLHHILIIYGLVFIAYLPWMPSIIHQSTHNTGTVLWGHEPSIIDFFYYVRYSFNDTKTLQPLVWGLYMFLFLKTLKNLWPGIRRGEVRVNPFSPGLVLVLWFVVPFSLYHLSSLVAAPVMRFRYLIMSLPAVYILFSRSITQLPLSSRNQAIVVLLVLSLFMIRLVVRMDYYSEPKKEQIREAVSYIIEQDRLYEDSLIIGYSWELHKYPVDYYFERRGSGRRVDIMAGRETDIPSVSRAVSGENPRYLWYVWIHKPPEPAFIEYLNNTFECVETREFLLAEVWLYNNSLFRGESP